jgi:hypothetical protein
MFLFISDIQILQFHKEEKFAESGIFITASQHSKHLLPTTQSTKLSNDTLSSHVVLLAAFKSCFHSKNGVFWDVTSCGSCKNLPEDTIRHSHCRENLKSYIVSTLYAFVKFLALLQYFKWFIGIVFSESDRNRPCFCLEYFNCVKIAESFTRETEKCRSGQKQASMMRKGWKSHCLWSEIA